MWKSNVEMVANEIKQYKLTKKSAYDTISSGISAFESIDDLK